MMENTIWTMEVGHVEAQAMFIEGVKLLKEGKLNVENLIQLTIMDYKDAFKFINNVTPDVEMIYAEPAYTFNFQMGYLDTMADMLDLLLLYKDGKLNEDNLLEIADMTSDEVADYLYNVDGYTSSYLELM